MLLFFVSRCFNEYHQRITHLLRFVDALFSSHTIHSQGHTLCRQDHEYLPVSAALRWMDVYFLRLSSRGDVGWHLKISQRVFLELAAALSSHQSLLAISTVN